MRRRCLLALFLGAMIAVSRYSLINTKSVLAACEVKEYSSPEDYQIAIGECRKEIEARQGAQEQNKTVLATMEANLAKTQKLLTAAEKQLTALGKTILSREVDLEYQQEILAARIRRSYIRERYQTPLSILLSSASARQLSLELSYRKMAAEKDQEVIAKILDDLKKLTSDREALAKNKTWLVKTKAEVDKQATALRLEVKKVDEYFSDISGKIAQLSAKQQALLSEKTGTFQTTVGDVPLADDPNSRPDYNPGFSPAFAVFSFGAPHRKGMSQYGAWGRAKSGQSAEEILRAYYGNTEIKKDYPNINITVRGYGTLDLETYAKRIYEMPGGWTENDSAALKAQAVAARSYALAYTNEGRGSICATENCQVYKPANKGGAWDAAVEATRGWVLMAGGKPFSAWYAASSGGYNYSYSSNGQTTPGGWDTKCGNQGCWTNDAYEKIAGSPWFYKSWYKSRSGATCGRSHPWLTGREMADILNAVLVYRSGDSADRILPIDYQSCFGAGGNPFSLDEMASKANSHGGAFNSVSGFNVAYGTNGETNKIIFSTDKGSFEVNGGEFYTVFNLRAPGRISLKSKLFNLEKK